VILIFLNDVAADAEDEEKVEKKQKKKPKAVEPEPAKDPMLVTPEDLEEARAIIVEKGGPAANSLADSDYELVNTLEALDKWIEEAKTVGVSLIQLHYSHDLESVSIHSTITLENA
jgi:hypothetical protein